MMLVPGFLLVVGLLNILIRRNFLGVLVGIQILGMGMVSLFVAFGSGAETFLESQMIGFFVLLMTNLLMVVGFALAESQYDLRGSIDVEKMDQLKHENE